MALGTNFPTVVYSGGKTINKSVNTPLFEGSKNTKGHQGYPSMAFCVVQLLGYASELKEVLAISKHFLQLSEPLFPRDFPHQ